MKKPQITRLNIPFKRWFWGWAKHDKGNVCVNEFFIGATLKANYSIYYLYILYIGPYAFEWSDIEKVY